MRFGWNKVLWIIIGSLSLITTAVQYYLQLLPDQPINDSPVSEYRSTTIVTTYSTSVQTTHNVTESSVSGKPKVTAAPVPPPDLSFKINFTDADSCQKKPYRRRLVAMILSAPNHFENRQMVRSTWVNYLSSEDVNGTYFFVIGTTPDDTLQQKITVENAKYDDIVQYEVHDSYRNLTYKTLAGLKFLNTLCSESNFDYVLKTDDDMFVHIPRLLSFADQHNACGRYQKRSFFCDTFRVQDEVPRDAGNKWYIPWEEYGDRFYPRFCSGTGYMFTRDLVEPLLETAKIVPYFHLEDVYTSGILARRMGNVSHVLTLAGSFGHTYQHTEMIEKMYKDVGHPRVTAPVLSDCANTPNYGTESNRVGQPPRVTE